MTSAKIKISPDLRLDLISEVAGQTDPDKRIYRDGFLEVEGVTQEQLEAAVSSQYVSEKIQSDKLSKDRKEALSQKWPDPFDLLDDILSRGIPTVKAERDAIKSANPKG